jgi:hypothetical protein
VIEKDEQDIL